MAAQTIPFPNQQCLPDERELLMMILDNAHVHDCAIPGKSIMTVLLTSKQIDQLCSYGAADDDVEDSDDDEDLALTPG